jgi:NADPH-dependent curcumin reductase CurA
MSVRSREIRLASHPSGALTADAFRTVEVDLPDPGPGEVLVANTLMSVDPYMRGRMDPGPSYMPAFELDRPLDGGAVGRVIASGAPGVPVGTLVTHGLGWREHSLVPARHVRPIDERAAPPGAYLGVLGSPGWTAYVGLLEIGALRDGDVVFVSGAAGAVGSIAGQIARIRGHRVIGSAGSAAKVAHLRDRLGFDAAFDYRSGPVAASLHAAAPDGIDLYFDNVGGEHLEAALDAMRMFGRVAVCGAIAGYDAAERPPGPSNLHLLFARRITMRGFMVRDHRDRFEDFRRDVTGWLADGRLRADETVVEGGLDAAPDAMIGLLRGDNVGKMLVRLADDPGPEAG